MLAGVYAADAFRIGEVDSSGDTITDNTVITGEAWSFGPETAGVYLNAPKLQADSVDAILIDDSHRNKDKLMKFLDIIPEFYLNLDKFFIHTEAVNKDHYIDIINILNLATQVDKVKTINICNEYFQSLETKYPFWKITNNLLIFRDFAPNFYRLISSTPINKFSEEITKILFNMIEDNKEEEFYNYFFDWILKYGYLIEAYIKEYRIFQLDPIHVCFYS